MSPIEAVVFDLGGVVLTSPFEAFAHYEAQQGLPDGFIRRLNMDNHDGNSWAKLERGQLDDEGFVREFEAEALAAGGEVDGHAILEMLVGEVRPEMAAEVAPPPVAAPEVVAPPGLEMVDVDLAVRALVMKDEQSHFFCHY